MLLLSAPTMKLKEDYVFLTLSTLMSVYNIEPAVIFLFIQNRGIKRVISQAWF